MTVSLYSDGPVNGSDNNINITQFGLYSEASPDFSASDINVTQYGWGVEDVKGITLIQDYIDKAQAIYQDVLNAKSLLQVLIQEASEVESFYQEIKKVQEDIHQKYPIIVDQYNEIVSLAREVNDSRDAASVSAKAASDKVVQAQGILIQMQGLNSSVQSALTNVNTRYNEIVALRDEVKAMNTESKQLVEDLRKGQVYRGTWNPHSGAWPDPKGTYSAWDVVLNPKEESFDWNGIKWLPGDRLLYILSEARYEQVESGVGVLSVNSKSGYVTLVPNDLGAYTKAEVDAKITPKFNTAGGTLTGAVTGPSFVQSGAQGTTATSLTRKDYVDGLLATKVDKTITVNGKPLSGSISLTSDDVGARSITWVPGWTDITGVPTIFPPSAHQHSWGDLTGVPVQATRWPTFDEIAGKPAGYPVAGHTHPWGEITGKPDFATRWPTASEVKARPDTWNPSSLVLVNKTNANVMTGVGYNAFSNTADAINFPSGVIGSGYEIVNGQADGKTLDSSVFQLWSPNDSPDIFTRTGDGSATGWVFHSWNKMYTSADKPTPADLGALSTSGGTATGNITAPDFLQSTAQTNNAAASTRKDYVDTQDNLRVLKTTTVNGKPLSGNITLTPADIGAQPEGGVSNSAKFLTRIDTRADNKNPSSINPGFTQEFKLNTTDGFTQGDGTYHTTLSMQQWGESSGGFAKQLAIGDNGKIGLRVGSADYNSWGPWSMLYSEAHKPTSTDVGAIPVNRANGTPVAAYFTDAAISSVGTKITLPYAANAGKMLSFTVRVYQGYHTADIQVSGYLYSAIDNWYAPKAIMIAGSTPIRVKMGKDANGKAYVHIAGSDYRGIGIFNVVSGYSEADWNSGWVITKSDDAPNAVFDTTIYPPYSPNNKPTSEELNVIGINKKNILNNVDQYGVGFVSARESGMGWIATYHGTDASDKVVLGTLNGGATVGAHNSTLTAWSNLFVGCDPNSTPPTPTIIGNPYARKTGSAENFPIYHTGNKPTSSDIGAIPKVGSTTWVGSGVQEAVVGQLSWKNYGNGHVIFDASQGTSPNGTAINNTNPTFSWNPTYPTLMGWNGAGTYGVRVDSARVADTATDSVKRSGDTMTGPLKNNVELGTIISGRSGFEELLGVNDGPGAGGAYLGKTNYWIRTGNATEQPKVIRGGTSYEIYHKGNKPTPAEISAMGVTPPAISIASATPSMELHKPGVIAAMYSIDANNRWALSQTDGNAFPNYTHSLVDINTGQNYFNAQRWTNSMDHSYAGQWSQWSPLTVDFGTGAGTNDYYPVIKGRHVIGGQGYTTDVEFGMLRAGNYWGQAIIRVGSAEQGSASTQADYYFDIGGNFTASGAVYGGTLKSGGGGVYTTGQLAINNSNPTIWLQDTDNRSAAIHNNGNLLYILRGQGNNAIAWDGGPNGRHPMTLNLETGDVVFSGNVVTYSDRRLKKDVKPLENALEKVMKLDGVNYKRIGNDTDRVECGFIAQDLQEVIPEVVIEQTDEDKTLAVDYAKLNAYLVEAIKEQQKMIEELKYQIDEIKGGTK